MRRKRDPLEEGKNHRNMDFFHMDRKLRGENQYWSNAPACAGMKVNRLVNTPCSSFFNFEKNTDDMMNHHMNQLLGLLTKRKTMEKHHNNSQVQFHSTLKLLVILNKFFIQNLFEIELNKKSGDHQRSISNRKWAVVKKYVKAGTTERLPGLALFRRSVNGPMSVPPGRCYWTHVGSTRVWRNVPWSSRWLPLFERSNGYPITVPCK